MEDISKRSGESIENILNFYKYPEEEDYDFKRLFDVHISDYKWEKIFKIYGKTRVGFTLDEYEDRYWEKIEEKNNNSLLSTDNEVTIIEVQEEDDNETNTNETEEKDNKTITTTVPEENKNGLLSTDNEVTIIEVQEEDDNETNTNETEEKDNKTITTTVPEENNDELRSKNNKIDADNSKENINVNYLSKIKEAKELLDNGIITQQEYDEVKWKYLDLI